MADKTNVRNDIDQFVFAVDIVTFVFNRLCKDLMEEFTELSVVNEAESYRDKVGIRFNNNVESMLDIIYKTQFVITQREFFEMSSNRMVNLNTWVDYCKSCRETLLYDGIQPKELLICMSRVAAMACHFFAHGVPEALDQAINTIASDLSEAYISVLAAPEPYDWREPMDLFTNEDSGNDSASSSDDSEGQSTSGRPVSEASTSEGLGVASATAGIGRLRVASAASTGPDSRKSDPSPTSEGAEEEGISSTAGTSKDGQSTSKEDIVEEFPSGISAAGESSKLGKRSSADIYDTTDNSKVLEPESPDESFMPGGGKLKMNQRTNLE